MVEIVIDKVTKTFGTFTAIDTMDMSFENGRVACLLGPSGCGKTTLMRMIVGLERPTRGLILFDGRDVSDLPARRRNVGMVFQRPPSPSPSRRRRGPRSFGARMPCLGVPDGRGRGCGP